MSTDRADPSEPALTHLDASGAARMVDVSAKRPTARKAIARATVQVQPDTLKRVVDGAVAKGSVFEVARLAGIMAAKRTPDWIPLCHPIQLSSVALDLDAVAPDRIEIAATATAADRTGVEMEAMVAASAAALTVYDMLKAIEKGIVIGPIRLERKEGGKSGTYDRGAEESR